MTLPTPTPGQTDRLRSAIIQKATRFFVLHNDPLGFGDFGEFGPVVIRPDYAIREYLYGMHAGDFEVGDLAALVTPEEVIRNGFGVDPSLFPDDRLPDIEREIAAAADWVATDLEGAFGVA